MMKNIQNSAVKAIAFQKPSQKAIVSSTNYAKSTKKSSSKSKKKLNLAQYNFKQVSTRIVQAKTSGSAARAVLFARSKVAALRRKVKTGEYDDYEIDAAIIHAEKMLRIAKKKNRNLLEEERAQKAGKVEQQDQPTLDDFEEEEAEQEEITIDGQAFSKKELEQLLRELEQMMQEAMEALEDDELLGDLSEEMIVNAGDLDPQELEMRKKKHRADEMRAIAEADMKYLRALFGRLEKEKANAASGMGSSGGMDSSSGSGAPSGVSVELGGVQTDVMITEAQVPVSTEGANMDVTV